MVGFAVRFPGILPVSMQRSGRGGAVVGFAAWFSGILPVSKRRSGRRGAVVGFAVRNPVVIATICTAKRVLDGK